METQTKLIVIVSLKSHPLRSLWVADSNLAVSWLASGLTHLGFWLAPGDVLDLSNVLSLEAISSVASTQVSATSWWYHEQHDLYRDW
jgi:hypothetical protein